MDQVSEVVATGTLSPPARWSYGYQNYANGDVNETVPFLASITVPSPTGSGTSTAAIHYSSTTDAVTSVVDGNGNSRNYSVVDSSHTQVTVKNAAGTTVTSYTVGFNASMAETSRTDGAGTVLYTATYADPNDPLRPSSATDATGITASFTWDTFGHLLTETSPRSTVTTYTWDFTHFALGRLTSVQQGGKTATTISYYEPSGLPQTVTTPAPGGSGTVSGSFTYSSLGNVLTVTTPGNNAVPSMTTTLGYTTDGTYSQNEARGEPLTVTDNLGKTWHLRYDSRGNTLSSTDPLGNEGDAAYNLADQAISTTLPATGQTGTGHAQTVTTYLYPGGPATTVTAYDESGSQVRQTTFGYGLEGELLTRTGSAEPVTLAYDAAYRPVSLSDGNSHSTSYQYNTAGYLSQVSFPSGTVQFPSYDAAGRLLQQIDARGVVTNYLYTDAAAALTDVQYPATPAINVHLTYDAYDRVSAMTDGTGSHSVSYDDLDETTSATTTYTGLPARTISYGFNPDGSRSSMTLPAGTALAYSYDGRGALVGLTDPYGYSYAWSYLDNGWLKTQTLPASVTSTWTYNALGQPVDLTTKSSAGAVLSEYGSVIYDGVGNTKSVTATVAGSSSYGGLTSYSYDSKDQLTQESSARNGGYTSGFGYDSAGNPTTFKGAGHSFNSSNQDTANTYDLEGNPTTYQGTGMTWDAEDRLTGIGASWTAGYRGDSLRAWKQNGSTRTYFLYDGGTPVAEMDGSGNVTAVNTFGAAGLLARKTSVGPSFYTFDLQGNVAQRVGSTGGVQASFNFDAYGVGHVTTAADPFGYGAQAGYYTDLETGLQAMSYRYYDPGAGRWLNRDPAGYGGGINLYGYCANGPVGGSDPTGMKPWYDQLRDWARSLVEYQKGIDNEGGADKGAAGVAVATYVNTILDLGVGVVSIPSDIGHLGEGFGCFAADPKWENLGGVGKDMATAAGVGLAAAGAVPSLRNMSFGGGACFPAGTPVATRDGEKRIEEVKAGDEVFSANPRTGQQSYQPVARTFVHQTDALCTVRIQDGQSVECTPEHPFWVEGKGFVAAKRLARSDLLVDADGRECAVASVSTRWERCAVYNFEVAATHTYFVGDGRWWVHNACGDELFPPNEAIIVRGGIADLDPPGTVFSGAYGNTLEEAASGVPHGTIRSTTAGAIRNGGGSVVHLPELSRGGVMNHLHVNITEGPGPTTFSEQFPNPVPGKLRIH